MTILHLRQIRLRPGEEHRDSLDVALLPLSLGGQDYLPVPAEVPAEVAVTKTTSGRVFTLAFTVRIHGACFRCLEDAVLEEPIRAREYQADDPEGDEELMTEYVRDDVLDVSAWAHDAVALALPDKILCRPDCAGLCPVCGKSLNVDPHVHEETAADPRWAALEKLRDEA